MTRRTPFEVTEVITCHVESTIKFNTGDYIVISGGQRKFFNKHGKGLCCSPRSRHYEACYEMVRAMPLVCVA